MTSSLGQGIKVIFRFWKAKKNISEKIFTINSSREERRKTALLKEERIETKEEREKIIFYTNHKSQITNHKSQTTNHKPQT